MQSIYHIVVIVIILDVDRSGSLCNTIVKAAGIGIATCCSVTSWRSFSLTFIEFIYSYKRIAPVLQCT